MGFVSFVSLRGQDLDHCLKSVIPKLWLLGNSILPELQEVKMGREKRFKIKECNF